MTSLMVFESDKTAPTILRFTNEESAENARHLLLRQPNVTAAFYMGADGIAMVGDDPLNAFIDQLKV